MDAGGSCFIEEEGVDGVGGDWLWAVKWSNFWDTQTQRERHKLLSIVHKYSNGHGCFVTQTQ